jgi:hypothetical protein
MKTNSKTSTKLKAARATKSMRKDLAGSLAIWGRSLDSAPTYAACAVIAREMEKRWRMIKDSNEPAAFVSAVRALGRKARRKAASFGVPPGSPKRGRPAKVETTFRIADHEPSKVIRTEVPRRDADASTLAHALRLLVGSHGASEVLRGVKVELEREAARTTAAAAHVGRLLEAIA